MDKFKIVWKCGECDILHDVIMEGNGVATAIHGTVITIASTKLADTPTIFQMDDDFEWQDVSTSILMQIMMFEIFGE
jgi:hypothetical protein